MVAQPEASVAITKALSARVAGRFIIVSSITSEDRFHVEDVAAAYIFSEQPSERLPWSGFRRIGV